MPYTETEPPKTTSPILYPIAIAQSITPKNRVFTAITPPANDFTAVYTKEPDSTRLSHFPKER